MARYDLGELIWKITGDSKPLETATNNADRAINKTADNTVKASKTMSTAMSGIAAAAGLAAIGAIANLIGGAVMVNAYGMISEQTGSYTLAMLPLAVLCLAGGIAVLIMGRQARNAQLHEKQVTHS